MEEEEEAAGLWGHGRGFRAGEPGGGVEKPPGDRAAAASCRQ